MLPTNFEGTNMPMGRPLYMSAEECSDLEVRCVKTSRGKMYTSCWQPSYEDIKNMVQGKAVIVQMHLDAVIYARIGTTLKDDPPLYAFNRVIVWAPATDQLLRIQKGIGIYISFLTDRFPVMTVYVNEK